VVLFQKTVVKMLGDQDFVRILQNLSLHLPSTSEELQKLHKTSCDSPKVTLF
jgi:hypothetical protein